MKVNYKGFEIDVCRENCNAGYELLYYSIFRISDGWEMSSGYQDTDDTVKTMIQCFKGWVDDYYQNPEDYIDGR